MSGEYKVDHFEECEDLKDGLPFGTIKCFCYIQGEEDKPYDQQNISMSELYDFLNGEKGKIWVTPTYDTENCQSVNFYTWYNEMKHTLTMYSVLSDFINRRRLAKAKQQKNNI